MSLDKEVVCLYNGSGQPKIAEMAMVLRLALCSVNGAGCTF